jgi:hypothetical protein
VIGTHAWFLPALVEKSLVLLAMGDWEQAVETAQRALSQADSGDGRGGAQAGTIDALRVVALYALSQVHTALTPSHPHTLTAHLHPAPHRSPPTAHRSPLTAHRSPSP